MSLCRLVLEDGSVWHGTAFGHTGVQGGYYFFLLVVLLSGDIMIGMVHIYIYILILFYLMNVCSGRMRV